MTLAEFQKRIDAIQQHAHHGCGDGHCIIRRPGPGRMHTNGGCQCQAENFAYELLELINDMEKNDPPWAVWRKTKWDDKPSPEIC